MQINNNLLSKNPITFISLFLDPTPEVVFSIYNAATPLEQLSKLYPYSLLPFSQEYTVKDFLSNFKNKESLSNQLKNIFPENISYLYFVYICLVCEGRLPVNSEADKLILPKEYIFLIQQEFKNKIKDLANLTLVQQLYNIKNDDLIMKSKTLHYFYKQFKQVGDLVFNNLLDNRNLDKETEKFSLLEIANALLFTELDNIIVKKYQNFLCNLPVLNSNKTKNPLFSLDPIVLALTYDWIKTFQEDELMNIDFNIDMSSAYSSMELFV